MALHRLSPLTIKTARPGRLCDGAGLYLYVSLNPKTRDLRKSWVYRFQSNGRRRTMGLGSVNDVSLQEARERAAAARKLHKDGRDPIETTKAARTAKRLEPAKAMTFDQCAEAYIADSAGWRSVRRTVQWTETLKTYASPVIGSMPVAQIDVSLVIKALQPIWTSKPITAGRVRQRVQSVLDWATASGFRQGDNPAKWQSHLENLLPPLSNIRKVKHLAALPHAEVAAFLADLRKRPDLAARALEFTILTAARSREVLGARWSEIDFDQRGWTVPAERTKAHREHRVPLSTRALEILKGVPRTGDKIFKLTHSEMWELVHSNLTVHGFRSTFRDWCAEQTNFPRQIVEAALGHVVGDETERAWRDDVLETRRRLMDAWSRSCMKPVAEGKGRRVTLKPHAKSLQAKRQKPPASSAGKL